MNLNIQNNCLNKDLKEELNITFTQLQASTKNCFTNHFLKLFRNKYLYGIEMLDYFLNQTVSWKTMYVWSQVVID